MAAISKLSDPFKASLVIRYHPKGWYETRKSYVWAPPTDVFETDKDFVVRIEIAGVRPAEISVHIEDRHLVVIGTRKESSQRRVYHQMEIKLGDFKVNVELPMGLALEATKAEYEEGFLVITIPLNTATTIQVKG
jgi:HSP20 family protein